MTFQINGSTGKYDKIVQDESVRYGRNAVENNISYMEAPLVNDNYATPPVFNFLPNTAEQEQNLDKLDNYIKKNDEYLNSLPPLEFEYRYIPNFTNGNIDKKALLGAAYEEMGTKELEVDEFEKRFLINDEFTAEPLDINKDGKIDISEYGANILATDLLSKDNHNEDLTKIDGTINSKGLNAILEYSQKSRAAAATKLYSNIYNKYNLGGTLDSFKEI